MKRSRDPRPFSLRFRHFAWTVRLLFSRGRPDNGLYGISVKTADGHDLYLLSRKPPVVANSSETTRDSMVQTEKKPLTLKDYSEMRKAGGLTPSQEREVAKLYPRIVPVKYPTKPPKP